MEDRTDDKTKRIKETMRDRVAIEYTARISPMKVNDRGNDKLDNITTNRINR